MHHTEKQTGVCKNVFLSQIPGRVSKGGHMTYRGREGEEEGPPLLGANKTRKYSSGNSSRPRVWKAVEKSGTTNSRKLLEAWGKAVLSLSLSKRVAPWQFFNVFLDKRYANVKMLLTSAEFCLLFKSSIHKACVVLLTAEIVWHEFLIKIYCDAVGIHNPIWQHNNGIQENSWHF